MDKMLILSTLKKYWKLILISLILVTIYFIWKRNWILFPNDIKKVEDSYLAQIAQINSIREQENIEHQKNIKQLQKQLTDIQSKYEQSKKRLEQNKVNRTNTIIKETNNNPIELAERLSKVTGIPIR